MKDKYWVPSIGKAHQVLELIASEPNMLKLIDISRKLDIHKSSMFSLLHTLEQLHWVVKDKGDTYGLGSFLGTLGSSYFRQYDIIEQFNREAYSMKERVGEAFQLAKLEGNEVLYLAKQVAQSPVRLTSEPGTKLPAHGTALGLTMLAHLSKEQILLLYPEEPLVKLTSYSIPTRRELITRLEIVRREGYALDLQEAVIGFCCVAAPIRARDGTVTSAVSCSMPQHHWAEKRTIAQQEIIKLAQLLSQ